MDNNMVLEQILKNQKKLNRRFSMVLIAACGYILYKLRTEKKENTK